MQDMTLPETKALAGPALSVKDAHEAVWRNHGAFMEVNDRLGDEARRGREDVVTREHLGRVNEDFETRMRDMERAVLASRRPATALERGMAAPSRHKAAFEAYVRAGDASGYRDLETRALSVGSGPDGGYTAPPEVEAEVIRRLAQISPIRAIAGNRQISTATYKRPFAKTGPVTGWVGETAARTETASPVLAEQVYPAMELYAMPSTTQALLDDSAVDIDQWLASEIEVGFAEQEGKAFVTGDGVNKPTGFLSQTIVANASWSWTLLSTARRVSC